MKKIILHIGMHKTGSTAIQFWLGANRENLMASGVLYPRTDRPPDPILSKHASLHHALMDPSGDFDSEWRLIRNEFQASGCHTMILSAEGLSAPRYRKLAPLRALADDFEVIVIGFFRRQDYMVEALWNQQCKAGKESASIAEFARRPFTRGRLRYDRILDFWAEFATVRALAYPEDGSEDSVARFASAADLPYDGSTRHENRSPSMNCAALCAILNRWGLSRISPMMPRLFRADSRRYALGRVLRSEILEQVADGNRRLADVYGVRFPDARPVEEDVPLRLPSLKSLVGVAVHRPRRSSA